MLESNRQRVMDIKKQSEQNKQGIQEFIQLKREEEAKTRFVERKELEENEAYRQYQQEVAVTSMRAFINRQKESKKEFLARSKDDIRTMMHSHAVFEDSLRKNELHMTRIGAPRRESKKQKLDSYVKEILPIDRGQTGKPYTDALKLTAAIYFSPCESGTLLPQTKKKVGDLTRTTVGPSNGKRQIQAGQVISTLQDAFFKFQRWRPEGVKIADLVAILNRFNLGARKSQIERLAGEFGIDANDNLDVDDFVEVGVAIFTVMAPDVLVMDADGERRRSKSAEPLNFGKKSLVDLERSCISALGNTNISFTKSQTIQDDLAFHLSGAVKSRKAREREMLMLAYEAMEIQKLREQRPVKEASPKKEEPTATETSKELNTGKGHPARKSQGGFKLGKKDVLGKSDGAQDDDKESLQKTDVSLSDAPAPSNAFMGPSPVLGQSAATEQNQVAASSAAATGPFSFKKPDGGGGASKPFTSGGLAAMPAGAGGQFGNSATKKAEWQHHKHSTQPLQHSTQSLLEGEPFSQSSILHAVSRPESRVSRPRTSNEHSRPMTRQGSRPSSRQTEYREDDIIPTQVLDDQNSGGTTEAFKFKMGGMGPGARKPLDNLSTGSTLEQVREGLNLLPTASQPAPVDMSGLSRVQRMKLLQQQNAAAAPAGDAAQAGAAQDTPTHVSEQQPSDQDRVQPVPVAEASLFPRKPRRGNRPF